MQIVSLIQRFINIKKYRRNPMLNSKQGTFNRPRKWLSLANQDQNQKNMNNKNLQPLAVHTTSKSKFANNFVQNTPEKITLKELKLINRKETKQSKQSKENHRLSTMVAGSQQQPYSRPKSTRKNTFRHKNIFVHSISEVQIQLNIILDSLKTNNILNSNHMTNFTIKKEDLTLLLSKIVNLNIHGTSPIHIENLENFPYLNTPLSQIKKHLRAENRILQSKQFLFAQSMAFSRTSQTYQKQLYAIQTELQRLFTQKNLLESHVAQLLQKKQYLQSNTAELLNQTQKAAKEYHQLCQKNKIAQEQQSKLQQQIKTLQQQLAHILQKSQKIFTYAGDQDNNKHVKDASQHYLEIESQIYDYAAYLQSNSLANKLGYQPYPFDQLTKDIDGKLKKLNKTIIQEESFSVKDKERFMRDFLMESIDKYRKKDEEQWKMIIFRGKCVRNFIQKMKHLLQNWELKQEYLKNLRNEFAYDSENLVKQLNSLQNLPLCESCKPKIIPKKADLLVLYQKVEHLYKMGNSFY